MADRQDTNYSDADRERLATREGSRFIGPTEWTQCPEHPGSFSSHRWVWDDSVVDAEPEILTDCPACAALVDD